MSIVTGDILRLVVTSLWTDGNIIQNVFNAVVTGGGGPWTDGDIVDDAEAWADSMYGNLTGLTSNALDGSQIQVYKYDAIDDDWDEVGSQNWAWDPSAASDQLPRGVAGLINLKTTDPDVSGKKYIAGAVEDDVADGLWGAAWLAALVLFGLDWYTAFAGATSGATWTPGIWSVVETVFKAAVGSAIIPTIPAYQRRRKRGVGV